jgi:hypothetical protein
MLDDLDLREDSNLRGFSHFFRVCGKQGAPVPKARPRGKVKNVGAPTFKVLLEGCSKIGLLTSKLKES